MKKSGYLTRKKSNGKTYIYLRRSFRVNGIVKHENIYSFGPMPDALDKMYWFFENPEQFPDDLKIRKFELTDLDDWIMTIETRKTPTGRFFEL